MTAEERPERPEIVTDAMLTYLDELRSSGETNMFGAGPYVAECFGLDKRAARSVVQYWMLTFGRADR